MTKIVEVEGIGEAYTRKLVAIGIRTVADLLNNGCTPRGRQTVAAQTGISDKLILRWVNHVDLFRIKGVGSEYAELLECAGVDTVPELAQRKAENLLEKMVEVNEAKKLVRRLPTQAQVKTWIEQAQTLPRVITY